MERRRWKVPVTACWATELPEKFAAIGISRGPPRGRRGYKMYGRLAPGTWFRTVPAEEFCKRYLKQLDTLSPEAVLADLAGLANGRTPALLCFEPPPPDPNWCHRALVAAWLKDGLDVDVFEYGHRGEGAGWRHPKLPAFLRR